MDINKAQRMYLGLGCFTSQNYLYNRDGARACINKILMKNGNHTMSENL